jgi:hypothetical protein
MDTNPTQKILTHDERKAADAAFAGRPFNPAWSQSAKVIYDGLTRALPVNTEESPLVPSIADPVEDAIRSNEGNLPSTSDQVEPAYDLDKTNLPIPGADELIKNVTLTRQKAIEAGVLIDVTLDAQKIGLTFPVTVTRPLWEMGVAPSDGLSDAEKSTRLRDILIAFRLRLSSLVTLSPLIDFPAMLALPPGSTPQPVPLFALIQPDDRNQATVTLLLPNEVSATIVPLN